MSAELCGERNPFHGQRCERDYGHDGPHMNFANGTLAWGIRYAAEIQRDETLVARD